ncbi:hypothetical protein MAPG_08827 [Magnaporthiopsis poae ATCC 64411]|uniref:Glycogen debranching enzyme n=1 Tax=Magnaporthiopsis poae (strain ATCC 64411 / 73-15) TaxID=644358 RepID=A0A0C4E8C7_MAGP6|nr:hypothetical protein MAPG_08827 [Magnaporthiopsis poae ATCC 64411]
MANSKMRAAVRCLLVALLQLVKSEAIQSQQDEACPEIVDNLRLISGPFENFFLSDCHSAGHVILTSPVSDPRFASIGARVIFAWPAGNSGILAKFVPGNNITGNLGIRLVNSVIGAPLGAVYEPASSGSSSPPTVGISTQIEFNSSATITTAILGSVRTIRDFVEGGGTLQPKIQDAIVYQALPNGGARLRRTWFDNVTVATLDFSPVSGQRVSVVGKQVRLEAGTYVMTGSFNYPQLRGFGPRDVLKPEAVNSTGAGANSAQLQSLAFLSYKSKLLAGTWRFLTYFGRDSMISALLLQPVLSEGEGGAIEAVLGSVLDRVDSRDGSVCHEEVIGDYATWSNLQRNISSTEPQCDYAMVDTAYFLPVLMEKYLVQSSVGAGRAKAFLATKATFFTKDEAAGVTYGDMALRIVEQIMANTAAFASEPVVENLIRLKAGVPVGQWRDSHTGLGGGRVPFDVNTALAPAALRAIASLARAGLFPPEQSALWARLADEYAAAWEDKTLPFFDVSVPEAVAKELVAGYARAAGFSGPDQAGSIEGDVSFPAIALEGDRGVRKVQVMHTDTAFRLFLVNGTDDAQLSALLSDTAKSILRTFPAGLMTDVGIVVANPAFGQGDTAWYASTWTTKDYHGTVVWSFQLAMMARGLELQLSRCDGPAGSPAFCSDGPVMRNLLRAYNKLWDSIDANRNHLSGEVWSWAYGNGKFNFVDLGALSSTESDIVQLWSLTFLAVTRNAKFTGRF